MSIISDIKSVAEVVQKADNIDLYRKLLDVQAEAMDLMEKYNNLKEENKLLKEQLETAGKMTYKDKMYFREDDKDPYCSKCWDVDRKLVRMHGDTPYWFQCPSCKTIVQNGNQSAHDPYIF
ncbi:hypothetical protein [Metabacillus sp. Hm71]|uniref:hypothetical protein n=1 Tax=Metabacillus sp. Hm71 TaxID=3450743 RepID=UPI003F42A090